MPKWNEIQLEWETTEITFKDLAEKHGVKDSTIRSRKNREKWQRNAAENNATQRATDSKSVATKKDVAKPMSKRKEQKNRSGNPNPANQFAERNRAALKHGLFSRYMPKETLEIMGMVAGSNPADLIWMQIELQFAAIIRAQEIMFVESKNEMIKELKKHKETEWGEEVEYEFQFAWDRHATFMNAQTKAISELRASIKQFMELADSADERRFKLELMQQQIEKLKREGSPDNSKEDKLKEYFTALGGAFSNGEK